MTQPIRSSGTILKSLPVGFAKPEDGHWAFISVEVPDRERDIIRVKGISLENHRDDSPIKVIATTHKYSPLPDGTQPVIGKVEEFKATVTKAMGQDVPALAFRFSWAKEADGQLSPLAAKYKGLYDNGYLDSFSGGFSNVNGTAQRGGGLDVAACKIYEISACMIPVNPYTTVCKALSDALGEDFDRDAYFEQRLVELQKSIDAMRPTDESTHLLDAINKAVEQINTDFIKRFDDFESQYVATAQAAKLPGDHITSQPDSEDLSRLEKAISAFSAKLPQPRK